MGAVMKTEIITLKNGRRIVRVEYEKFLREFEIAIRNPKEKIDVHKQ